MKQSEWLLTIAKHAVNKQKRGITWHTSTVAIVERVLLILVKKGKLKPPVLLLLPDH